MLYKYGTVMSSHAPGRMVTLYSRGGDSCPCLDHKLKNCVLDECRVVFDIWVLGSDYRQIG